MTRIFSINISAASGATGNLNGRAGVQAITNGQSSVSVTFTSGLPSSNYALAWQVRNVTDGAPIFLAAIETARDQNGFTLTFNAPVDSANYVLEYIASQYA